MEFSSSGAAWARGVAGRAVWSASALAVPALAVLQERHVAQAIILHTVETVLAVLLLRAHLARALRGLAWDDRDAARLRAARHTAGLAAMVSAVLATLLLAFYVAYDVRPPDLFDAQSWPADAFDGFGDRVQWMAFGLLAGAVLEAWLAPPRTTAALEASAAWLLRRVAAPAFAYLPGAALTAWAGTTAGFLWPWFVVRAFTDLTALFPGARERARAEVFRDA